MQKEDDVLNKKLFIAYFLVIAITIASLVFAVGAVKHYNSKNPKFSPPPFEKNAVSGKPDAKNIKSYSEMQAADAYIFGLCGEVTAKDGYVDVYFTSIEGNNAWLKIRILDENENIIAESGLIKPGQYIKSVKLNTEINSAINVTLKVMGYEPETYFSAGAVTLKTTLNV